MLKKEIAVLGLAKPCEAVFVLPEEKFQMPKR
jgi:hypothetical protein